MSSSPPPTPDKRPVKSECVLATPLPVKRRFSLNDSQLSQTKFINQYKTLSYKFELTTRSFMIIRRIVTDHNIPASIRVQPLLRKVTDACKEMMMTELEIIIWSMYLDRFVWRLRDTAVLKMLYITAYAAKLQTNEREDTYIFQAYLADKISRFTQDFDRWHALVAPSLVLLPEDLNGKFQRLTRPPLTQNDRRIINYNYYVDELLEQAPPYQTDKKLAPVPCSLTASAVSSVLNDALYVVSDEEEPKPEGVLTLSMLNPEIGLVSKIAASQSIDEFPLIQSKAFFETSQDLNSHWNDKESPKEEGIHLSRSTSLFSRHFNNQ